MVDLFATEDDDIDIQDAEAEADKKGRAAAAPAVQPVPPPRENAELIGHEAAEQALLSDFYNNKLPHALVLTGPSGIGKATFAFRLARFLFSQAADGGDSLFGLPDKATSLFVKPEDPVFRRVASGGHADLLTVEREFDDKKDRLKTEISVDAVRKINPFLRKTSAEGGWRVVIIDQAEYLNNNGQNALLKILEEPPQKTLLILTTSRPGAFLPTIRSRCRFLDLSPLDEKNLQQLLSRYADIVDPRQAQGICRLAEGSIGRALQLADGKGMAFYQQLCDVFLSAPGMDMLKAHDFAEKHGRYGAEKEYEAICDMMSWIVARALRLMARGEDPVDILPGDAAVYRHIIAAYGQRGLLTLNDALAQVFYQTDVANLDKRQALLSAFSQIQKPRELLPLAG
jgi:DNA polymerase-3 subunit delta'